MKRLHALSEVLQQRSLPPVQSWHPDASDEIDIRIAANGDWFHEGARIERLRMVRLFSTVLRKDGDDTYLVTPDVKLRITVDDAPFLAVALDTQGVGAEAVLTFTTNVEDQTVADAAHPLRVTYPDPGASPNPYVLVRHRLEARLTRSVFLQLADQIVERGGQYGVWSSGTFMPLGDAAETGDTSGR